MQFNEVIYHLYSCGLILFIWAIHARFVPHFINSPKQSIDEFYHFCIPLDYVSASLLFMFVAAHTSFRVVPKWNRKRREKLKRTLCVLNVFFSTFYRSFRNVHSVSTISVIIAFDVLDYGMSYYIRLFCVFRIKRLEPSDLRCYWKSLIFHGTFVDYRMSRKSVNKVNALSAIPARLKCQTRSPEMPSRKWRSKGAPTTYKKKVFRPMNSYPMLSNSKHDLGTISI